MFQKSLVAVITIFVVFASVQHSASAQLFRRGLFRPYPGPSNFHVPTFNQGPVIPIYQQPATVTNLVPRSDAPVLAAPVLAAPVLAAPVLAAPTITRPEIVRVYRTAPQPRVVNPVIVAPQQRVDPRNFVTAAPATTYRVPHPSQQLVTTAPAAPRCSCSSIQATRASASETPVMNHNSRGNSVISSNVAPVTFLETMGTAPPIPTESATEPVDGVATTLVDESKSVLNAPNNSDIELATESPEAVSEEQEPVSVLDVEDSAFGGEAVVEPAGFPSLNLSAPIEN